MFWFNLGCYHCQLGETEKGWDCVKNAVEIDPEYKKLAVSDPDLEPFWDTMKMEWP